MATDKPKTTRGRTKRAVVVTEVSTNESQSTQPFAQEEIDDEAAILEQESSDDAKKPETAEVIETSLVITEEVKNGQSLINVTTPDQMNMIIPNIEEVNANIAGFIEKINAIETITDKTSMKLLDGYVADAKKYIKVIEEDGKKRRKPYNDAASAIKKFFDDLVVELSACVTSGAQKVLNYDKELKQKEAEELRKKQEEQLKLQKKVQDQKDALLKWSNDLLKEINATTTADGMVDLYNSRVMTFNSAEYPLIPGKDIQFVFDQVVEAGKLHIQKIKNGQVNTQVQAPFQTEDLSYNAITESLNKVQAPIVSVPAKPIADVKLSTKTRNILSWKVENEAAVDDRFKSVDPVKVKAYMTQEKDLIEKSLTNGSEINVGGITFYYEEKPYNS